MFQTHSVNQTLWFDSEEGDWIPIYNDIDLKIDNDNHTFNYIVKEITEAVQWFNEKSVGKWNISIIHYIK